MVRIILPGIDGKTASTHQITREHVKPADSSTHPVSNLLGAVISPVGGGGSIESEARVAMLTDKVQALEAGHVSLKTTSAELIAQNAKLRESLEASGAKNAELEASVETANAARAELEAGLDASNARSSELAEQNTEMEAGLKASKTTSAEQDARNKKLEAGLEASNARSSELAARNEELKASVEASTATSAELHAQIAEMKAGLEESNATSAELATQTGKLAKLESEVSFVEAVTARLFWSLPQLCTVSSRRTLVARTRCANAREPSTHACEMTSNSAAL